MSNLHIHNYKRGSVTPPLVGPRNKRAHDVLFGRMRKIKQSAPYFADSALAVMVASLLLLPLLLVVEVQCQQIFPYVSFMGQTLAGHSYVDISLVGSDFIGGSNTVQCHTDLSTCCSAHQGIHRGDWYFPNRTRLGIPGIILLGNIFESRTNRRVDIRRINNANEPTGIYRCDIPTNAVHATDNSVRDSVCVGLYTSTGGELSFCYP